MANANLNPDDPQVLRAVLNQIKAFSCHEWIERLREYPDFAAVVDGAGLDTEGDNIDTRSYVPQAPPFVENA